MTEYYSILTVSPSEFVNVHSSKSSLSWNRIFASSRYSVDHIDSIPIGSNSRRNYMRRFKRFQLEGESGHSPIASRCRRRIAADATAFPLITAAQLGRQLSTEPVVGWAICWDSSADTKRGPNSAGHHFTELRKRPSPEATPASASRRHILPVE